MGGSGGKQGSDNQGNIFYVPGNNNATINIRENPPKNTSVVGG